MKILITIITFIFISCNQTNSNSHVIISQKDSNILKISDNEDIFKIWTMCATSDSNVMTQMNVCSTIGFNRNGTGYVGNNSLALGNFSWTLKKSGIKIYNSSTFPDTTYYVNFINQNGLLHLTLTHKEMSYYLISQRNSK